MCAWACRLPEQLHEPAHLRQIQPRLPAALQGVPAVPLHRREPAAADRAVQRTVRLADAAGGREARQRRQRRHAARRARRRLEGRHDAPRCPAVGFVARTQRPLERPVPRAATGRQRRGRRARVRPRVPFTAADAAAVALHCCWPACRRHERLTSQRRLQAARRLTTACWPFELNVPQPQPLSQPHGASPLPLIAHCVPGHLPPLFPSWPSCSLSFSVLVVHWHAPVLSSTQPQPRSPPQLLCTALLSTGVPVARHRHPPPTQLPSRLCCSAFTMPRAHFFGCCHLTQWLACRHPRALCYAATFCHSSQFLATVATSLHRMFTCQRGPINIIFRLLLYWYSRVMWTLFVCKWPERVSESQALFTASSHQPHAR